MILFEGIREAFRQMIFNRYITGAAVGIISIILLLFGIFLLSIYNLNLFAETLKSDIQVIVFFDKNITLESLQDAKGEIEGLREVEKTIFISKEQALDMLKQDMANVRGIIKELRVNPLPDSLKISPASDARTPAGIKGLVEKLKRLNGVEEVEYGEEWVERLNAFISTAKVIAAVVGGIMVLVVLFTVSNTVKFTLLTRREEIEIMKLSGATNLFVKIPFVIEGGLLGLIGAISSLLMLLLSYKLVLYKIPPEAYLWLGGMDILFIPWQAIVILISLSMALGCIGSWISIGRYLGVAIFLFLCLNIYNPVYADNQDIRSLEKKIEVNQDKLSDIETRIEEKKKASEKAVVEEKKVKKTIQVKQRDLTGKHKGLRKVNTEMLKKKMEIEQVQVEIDLFTADIARKKSVTGDFLRYIYKSYSARHQDTAGVLLSSADYHDFIIRSKYHDSIIGEANRIMKDIEEDMDALQREVLFLERKQHAILKEKDNLLSDKAAIEKDVKRNRRKLAGIQKKKAAYDQEIKRLTEASAAIKDLIGSYEVKRSRLAVMGAGFDKQKGILIWPLEGDVVSSFGRQKHPEFDAYVNKKGIEIASKSGRNVKAVYNGIVAYADWLKGYGLLTIIDHGGGFYSLYAHTSKIIVANGDQVKRGQVIALTGNGNGNLSGKDGVYFEIRHNGEAVDPMAWLNQR